MSERPGLLVDIVADPVCPWCYVGLKSFLAAKPDLTDAYEVTVRFRAYLLNPDTPAEGVDREAYYRQRFPDPGFLVEARKRIAEAAEAAGFAFDPSAPKRLPNTLKAHRLLRAAHFDGRQEQAALALYRGYWDKGADLGDDETLVALAAAAGMDEAATRAGLAAPPGVDPIRAEAEAMRRAGVAGVPTFIVNERTGFSGALPPQTLAAALARAAGA